MNIEPTPLNRKAVLVRLSISKPTTSKRDDSAEHFAQSELRDTGLRVTTTIFKDAKCPPRQKLNKLNEVYVYVREHTLPYEDRVARMLPISQYEKFDHTVRAMISKCELADTDEVVTNYDNYVAEDMARRGDRAKLSDYPTREQFRAAFGVRLQYSPVPDRSHFLFDISEDDKRALDEQLTNAYTTARQEMFERVTKPLQHMLERLKAKHSDPSSRFHESVVDNVVNSVEIVRGLAMGDSSIEALCDMVDEATTGHARNPQVMKDSPYVREQVIGKLEALNDKMSYLMGA